MKRNLHEIRETTFRNSPVEDVKFIVGTRNRQDARNDLIRKRPSRALLQNKKQKTYDTIGFRELETPYLFI